MVKEYLEDESTQPEVLVESDDLLSMASGELAQAFSILDDRSRAIIQARWLDEEKATLHELADRYGVSAERIRQIEKNALKKLRALLSDHLQVEVLELG